MTRTVSISELKARLSAYLDIVRQGDEILVTDRGRLIARLGPVAGPRAEEGRREELLRTGTMRPPSGELPPDFWDRARPEDPEASGLAALLAEAAASAPRSGRPPARCGPRMGGQPARGWVRVLR